MQLDSEVLKGLIKIQTSIYSEQHSQAELLSVICKSAMDLTGASGAVVEYIQNGMIEYRATAGACDHFQGLIFSAKDSLSILCVKENQGMLCTDVDSDPRVNRDLCRKIGVLSMAVVPLICNGRIMGVLKVISDQKEGFNRSTVEALTLISGFLATSIYKAEVEEEREVTYTLVEEQLRFRDSVTALVPNNIYIYDLVSKSYVYLNDGFYNFLGLSLEQIQKMGDEFFKKIIHPEDIAQLAFHLNQFKSAKLGDIIEFEIRAKNQSGDWRWMRVRESVFKTNEIGEVIQIIGVATDITSLQAQNSALENTVAMRTAQLNLLYEKIPNLIWHTDSQGNGIYVNQRWIDYTGMPLGSDFSKMIHPDDYENCMKVWGEALATKQDYQTEYRLKSKSGEYRWFFVRGVPTMGQNSDVTEWFGTCTDIHDKKTALESIHQAKVNEDAAKQASKLKTEFLANMSHEIRTPLNGVLGIASLLSQMPMSPKQKEYVEIIRSSGGMLLTLLNDILDISKIEAGKLEFESIEFPLVESIEEVRKTLSYLAESKGLNLSVELSPTIPLKLYGDPGRLKQILFNLVSNAIKFTENGFVRVICKEVSCQSGKSRIRFEIRDSGIGIKTEAMDKMFKSFSQADASTQRKFGGTGLGLSICKSLVERMNGEIGVVSQENIGSNFWFEVDLISDLTKFETSKLISIFQSQKPGSSRILIAEDNSVNQLITTAMIENLGFSVDVVKNGEEALNAVESRFYDLVLMDCHMPQIDGYEATRQIRKSPNVKNPNLKIIAMTANSVSQEAQKCKVAGMDDHMSKPLSIEDLSQRLEYWLQPKSETL